MRTLALLLALAGLAAMAACDFGFQSGPAATRCRSALDCPTNLICVVPPDQQVGQCEVQISTSLHRQGRTLVAPKRHALLAA